MRILHSPRVLVLLFALAPACNETDKTSTSQDAAAEEDAATEADASEPEDAGTPDCFEHPRTHEELINACTDAEKIEKEPTLPLLLRDGGLPPLP